MTLPPEQHLFKPDPEDPTRCFIEGRLPEEHVTELRQLPTKRAAKAAARRGAEQAYDGAEDVWKQDAYRHVRMVAANSYRTGEAFCSNDVWASGLADPPGDRRALAGVITRARQDGLIVHAGKGATSLLGHGSENNAWWLGTARATEPALEW